MNEAKKFKNTSDIINSLKDFNDLHIALVIYSLGPGGAERVMANMANYWSETGWKITIITQSTAPPFYHLHDQVLTVSLKSANNSPHILATICRNFRTTLKLIKILKRNQIDIVVSFMTTTNVMSVIAARSLRLPVIISERYNPWKFTPPTTWRVFRKWIYPFADKIVVQSIESRNFFNAFCKKNKVEVIYNPVSIPLNPIKEYNPSGIKTILSVGRLKYVKGYDLLIQAFANLKAPDWQLCIVGEGEERSNLEKLIADLGLKRRVLLPGQSGKVEDYYRNASLFVLSSRAEGFPNCLAEAMSYGLPCVSMDCETGPSVLIKNGENGLLIPNKKTEQLTAALQYLIDSPDIREQYGKAAHESMKEFGMDIIMDQWNSLINELEGMNAQN